jgi:hypothetical protein
MVTLFSPKVNPSLGPTDRRFIAAFDKFDEPLEEGELDVRHGLLHDDPVILCRGIKKLESTWFLIAETAREWERTR